MNIVSLVWSCGDVNMKLYTYTWSSEGWAGLIVWESEMFRWCIRVLQRNTSDGMNSYYKEDLQDCLT